MKFFITNEKDYSQHELNTKSLAVVGGPNSGKTSFVSVASGEEFSENHVTNALDFKFRYHSKEDLKIRYQLYDLHPNIIKSKFDRASFHRPIVLFIIVIDRTDSTALTSLDSTLKDIEANFGYVPKIIVGNKSDLNDLIVWDNCKIKQMCMESKLNIQGYCEISAKTSLNIDLLFDTITDMLFKKENKKTTQSIPNEITLTDSLHDKSCNPGACSIL